MIRCGTCDAAITDDLDIETIFDSETGVATADIAQELPYDLKISAEFEKRIFLIPPHVGLGVKLHIGFSDVNGRDITDEVSFSIADNAGNPSYEIRLQGNTLFKEFGFVVTTYGHREEDTNVIKVERLPDEFKPLDDIKITTVVEDHNSGSETTTQVKSDSDKVKIEKGEGYDYYITIFPELKETEQISETGETKNNLENKAEPETEKENGKDDNYNVNPTVQKGEVLRVSQNMSKPVAYAKVGSANSDLLAAPKTTSAPSTGDSHSLLWYGVAATISLAIPTGIIIKRKIFDK